MKTALLDTNLLIALFWPAHEHHAKAMAWFSARPNRRWATCPFTQAGFVRIVSNPAFSENAPSPFDAIELLKRNTAQPNHHFWTDEIPVALATAGLKVVGHQQITDAYLFGLARARSGILATLDNRATFLIQTEADGHFLESI